MVYMKHATLGNRLFPEAEVEGLRAQGWVKWPRTLSEKQGLPPEPISVCSLRTAEAEAMRATVEDAVFSPPKRKPGRPKKK